MFLGLGFGVGRYGLVWVGASFSNTSFASLLQCSSLNLCTKRMGSIYFLHCHKIIPDNTLLLIFFKAEFTLSTKVEFNFQP